MFKILHFADLHLDASFARAGMTPSVAKERRLELRSALRRILDKARELKVDAVTIAGDLYEYERVSPDTVGFLKVQFESIAPVPVVVAPGNHDPLLPGSPYREVEWASNVFIFRSPELSPHVLTPGITIWGAGHNSPSFRTNLLERFKVGNDGINMLLLHASDTTCIPPGKAVHCPFTPDQIIKSGIRLALLGHYHLTSLSPKDKPVYGYPGSPEPLGFDEEGPHHVLLVEIDNGETNFQLVPINTVNYRTIDVSVSEALSLDDIRESIRTKRDKDHLETCLVRVILKGALNPDVNLDLESLLNDCHEFFRFLDIKNQAYPAYDLESIKNENTVTGLFVRKMLKYLEEHSNEVEKRIGEQSLFYGLKALDGRDVDL